jgi:hypothetical protein
MSKFQTITSSAELDYPKVLPTLDLNFDATKTLDPRIIFTRSSGGTYVDETGIIRIAGVNQPRFDHNPLTGECLGLLVEESRSNNQAFSNTFNSAGLSGADYRWQDIVAVTAQNNLYPDPFGTNTATRIIPTTTSTSHYIGRYQAYGTAAHAHSVFLKPAGYSRVLVEVNGNTFTANLSGSGSFANNNSTTYATKIQAFSNGWYRLEWIWNNTGGGGANTTMPRIFILDNSGNSTFAGNGASGIDFFGYQQEFGFFCTSYIPTGASALTRARDNLSISLTPWYNNNEGTVLFNSSLSDSTDGTPSIIFGPYLWATAPNLWRTSGNQGILNTSSSRTTRTRHIFALRQNDHALCINGGSVSTPFANNSHSPSGGSVVGFNSSGSTLNGYLNRLTYWPIRLSNRTLQRLTE